MFSWRCGETVKVDEQVVLQESMEVSTPNVQIDIKKSTNCIGLLHIKLECSYLYLSKKLIIIMKLIVY